MRASTKSKREVTQSTSTSSLTQSLLYPIEALDVKDRLKAFNCGSPIDYKLVKQWKVGGALNDKTIHRALEKLGIERNREWFVMSEVEAVAYVGAMVEDALEHFVPESEELTSYEMNAILNPDKHLAEWIAQNTCA